MKKLISIICIVVLFVGCAAPEAETVLSFGVENDTQAEIEILKEQIDKLEKENQELKNQFQPTPLAPTPKPKVTFTNKFGTSTTICAHSGCSNYIASSGDTNCCSTHSNKCAECRVYIDEDALWCMSCLTKALK